MGNGLRPLSKPQRNDIPRLQLVRCAKFEGWVPRSVHPNVCLGTSTIGYARKHTAGHLERIEASYPGSIGRFGDHGNRPVLSDTEGGQIDNNVSK